MMLDSFEVAEYVENKLITVLKVLISGVILDFSIFSDSLFQKEHGTSKSIQIHAYMSKVSISSYVKLFAMHGRQPLALTPGEAGVSDTPDFMLNVSAILLLDDLQI
jgi:hypothetical protein